MKKLIVLILTLTTVSVSSQTLRSKQSFVSDTGSIKTQWNTTLIKLTPDSLSINNATYAIRETGRPTSQVPGMSAIVYSAMTPDGPLMVEVVKQNSTVIQVSLITQNRITTYMIEPQSCPDCI